MIIMMRWLDGFRRKPRGLRFSANRNAAERGYQEIVNQMLSLGATDYNRAMAKAAEGGRPEMIEFLRSRVTGPALPPRET